MNKDKLEKIQGFIKSIGVEDDPLVWSLMKIDTSMFNREKKYYESIADKYFKRKYDYYVEYVYIYPQISTLNFGEEQRLNVCVDNYSFRVYDRGISISVDSKHVLSNTKEDRYSDWTEINKEEFEFEINKILSLIENGKEILNNALA